LWFLFLLLTVIECTPFAAGCCCAPLTRQGVDGLQSSQQELDIGVGAPHYAE
jgi:hypothetical protein